MKAPSLTLGIEEEYQVVAPETGELRSYITQILKDGRITVEDVKPELHQSVLEVGSSICHTPTEIREEVVRLRTAVIDLAAKEDLKILAAGTHPFSSWMEQEITPLERYMDVAENLQELAKRNLIFGMHVHVGIEDQEFLIDAMKVARYFLPHVLGLVDKFTFLDGPKDGSQILSYRSSPEFSAYRDSSSIQYLRELRPNLAYVGQCRTVSRMHQRFGGISDPIISIRHLSSVFVISAPKLTKLCVSLRSSKRLLQSCGNCVGTT